MTSFDLERALKRAHSAFRIMRISVGDYPVMIYWYDNEICACPKGDIPPTNIIRGNQFLARGLKQIMDVLKSKAYMGYDYQRVEKMIRKIC